MAAERAMRDKARPPDSATRDLFEASDADPPALDPDDRVAFDVEGSPADVWRRVAATARDWLDRRALASRDAVVLVPFAQLIAPARAAFAGLGGWLPRIETARSLAESLAPAAEPLPGAPTLHAPVDRLLARRLLRAQPSLAALSRRDPRAFDALVARFAESVHELVRAAAAIDPRRRDATWNELASSVRPTGADDRDFAIAAVRWAAMAPAPRTDALRTLVPAAWIVVEAGGRDAIAAGVAAASGSPVLTIATDPAPGSSLAPPLSREAPAHHVCEGFEDEAESAAAQALAHIRGGERPVVLVATDRLLVRRASELLERAGAVVVDETGWRLSTTRAAARFMTLLVVARRDASSDAFFDWLKSGTRWADTWPRAIASLESRARRFGAARLSALATFDAGDRDAARLRDESLAALLPLVTLRDRRDVPLLDWLTACEESLLACGGHALLAADAAGAAVLETLGLGAGSRERHIAAVAESQLSLSEFTRWCDATLESATFRPPSDRADADVHVAPLARAMLRPFAAAVVPGADSMHLGAWSAPPTLLPRAAAQSIGVASPDERLLRERIAFAQLVRRVPTTLLRRRSDGPTPLGDSRYLARLELDLAAQGRALRSWTDPRETAAVAARPSRRAAASASDLVPRRLTATAVDSLRACPYRFFAHAMLGLREADELDGELDKRVFGSWLHDVLLRFHAARGASEGADSDATGLRAAADAVLAEQGLAAADFLPWQAAFDAFVPRYVAFLAERDRSGARWQAGEVAYTLPLEAAGVELYGRLDRVDEVEGATGPSLELIDYKAGSQSRWREQSKLGFEDTQLAFYAALVRAATGRDVVAAYLPLEGRPLLKLASHADVARSADALLAGVVADVARLRAGEALAALGAGSICDRCDARGLCRRDDWWPEERDGGNTAPGSPAAFPLAPDPA